MRGNLFGLVNHLLRRADHGRAPHGQRTGPVGPHPHRGGRRVAMDNLDLAFVNPDHLGNHLWEGGLMPLPVAVAAGHHADRTGRVYPHGRAFIKPCPRTELPHEVRRGNPASLNVAVHAQTAQLTAFLGLHQTRLEAGKITDLRQLIHRRVVIARVIFHRHRRGIGELGDEVLTTQFNRIDTQFPRSLVHDALQLERRLRPPSATIGINRHRVGKHGLHIHIDQRRLVVARHQCAVQPCRDRRREGRQVRAHIRIGLGPKRGEVIVAVQRQFDLGHMIAAMRVRHKRFGTRRGPFDRTPDLLGRKGAECLLRVMEDFGAEPTAHIRGNDAQLMLGDAQHERTHKKPDHMRVLAGGIERVVICAGVPVPYSHARLHRVGDKAVVDQFQRGHMRGLLKRCVHRVAVFFNKAPVVAKVACQIVMNLRGTVLNGGFHVDDRRQFFQIKLNRFRRIARLFQALGHNGTDWIAHMAHLALRQHRVRGFLHRLAMAVGDLPPARDRPDPFEIGSGENAHHTGHGVCRRSINPVDLRMRHIRAQEMHIGLAVNVDVVRIASASCQKPHVFAPL